MVDIFMSVSAVIWNLICRTSFPTKFHMSFSWKLLEASGGNWAKESVWQGGVFSSYLMIILSWMCHKQHPLFSSSMVLPPSSASTFSHTQFQWPFLWEDLLEQLSNSKADLISPHLSPQHEAHYSVIAFNLMSILNLSLRLEDTAYHSPLSTCSGTQ